MKSVLKRLSAIVLSLMLLASLASCSILIPEEETTTLLTARTALPETQDTVLDYFYRVVAMADADTDSPAYTFKTKTDIRDFECENELVKAAVGTIKNYVLTSDSIKIEYNGKPEDEDKIEELGEHVKLSSFFPGEGGLREIDPSIIKSFSSVWPDSEDDNGTGTMLKTKNYEISIDFNDNLTEAEIEHYFGMANKEEILAEFAKAKDYLVVEDYTVAYTGCKISFKVDVQTDNLVNITFERVANVTATATGAGELASVGNIEVNFNFVKVFEFNDFNWKSPLAES